MQRQQLQFGSKVRIGGAGLEVVLERLQVVFLFYFGGGVMRGALRFPERVPILKARSTRYPEKDTGSSTQNSRGWSHDSQRAPQRKECLSSWAVSNKKEGSPKGWLSGHALLLFASELCWSTSLLRDRRSASELLGF